METNHRSDERAHDQGDHDPGDRDDVVVVDRLTRRYGHGADAFVAVDGITMSVRRGELYAVLGTNGAGKTSALEVMEGLAPASAGVVRVFGHDPYVSRRAVRPLVGIMLQEGGFPDDLTVAETVRTWAGTLSTPRPVHEALELVDLGHRAGVQVKQLSGGERRRLDLAVAILGRPQLLFLDEPTAGLDPESRNRTWALVRALLAVGTTVVLTTHYLAEAEQLADRLAIMHGGRIVRTGTPAEVVAGAPAQVSFGLPADRREPLPGFPAVLSTTEATSTGSDGRPERLLTLETADVQRTLTAVMSWAAAHDVTLRRLEARAASLEHVFLDVVAGRVDNRHPAGHAGRGHHPHHAHHAPEGDEQGAAA